VPCRVPTSAPEHVCSQAGLTMDMPRGEDKDVQDDEHGSTSEAEDEEYYSSQESQEILNEDRNGSGEEDQSGEVYVTRSKRTSRPPERLIYDAQACLLSSEDYEEQESWIEQQLLASKHQLTLIPCTIIKL
jgi:hypothetical protein